MKKLGNSLLVVAISSCFAVQSNQELELYNKWMEVSMAAIESGSQWSKEYKSEQTSANQSSSSTNAQQAIRAIHSQTFEPILPYGNLISHSDRILSIIELHDGHLATSADDKTVQIWDWKKHTHVKGYAGHDLPIIKLVELPNKKLACIEATAANAPHGPTVHVWDLKKDRIVDDKKFHEQFVPPQKTLKDGKISLLGHNSELWICSVENPSEPVQVLTGHQGVIVDCTELDNGYIATASADKTIKIWDRHKQTCIKTIIPGYNHRPGPIIALGPDIIATTEEHDGAIKLWNWQTGKCLGVLHGFKDSVTVFAVLSDGSLVSGHESGFVRVWDAERLALNIEKAKT